MKKKRNLTLIIGAVLTAFMLLFLLIGFFYTPYDPDAMNGAAKFAAPSLSHPFGCDHFGRDIFSRVLKGTGTTFFVAFATLLQLVGSYIIFAYPLKACFRVKAKGNGLSLRRKGRFVVNDNTHIRLTLHAPD